MANNRGSLAIITEQVATCRISKRIPSIDTKLFDNGCAQVARDSRRLGRNDQLLSYGTLSRQPFFCT